MFHTSYHTITIKYHRYSILCLMLLILASCTQKGQSTDGYDNIVYTPTYASGFKIVANADSTSALIITSPWQGAIHQTFTYTLDTPASRIVAMSSTYVAMLEELDAVESIVGVSGLDFISSERLHTTTPQPIDVGYDSNVDYEALVALSPDLVLLYGVNGPHPMEQKLKELDIKYVYIGDYLEESPLGKAEWVVAIGALIGRQTEAEAIMTDVKKRYNQIKESCASVDARPSVMINIPYGDTWYMPSTHNYMSQLIADAGGNYIYNKNNTNKSATIDIEEAYTLAANADIWLNPGQCTTMSQFLEAVPRFADLSVVYNSAVYNNNLRLTEKGGNDFYESGTMRPDVILRDLAIIFHPELFENGTLTYYQQLK